MLFGVQWGNRFQSPLHRVMSERSMCKSALTSSHAVFQSPLHRVMSGRVTRRYTSCTGRGCFNPLCIGSCPDGTGRSGSGTRRGPWFQSPLHRVVPGRLRNHARSLLNAAEFQSPLHRVVPGWELRRSQVQAVGPRFNPLCIGSCPDGARCGSWPPSWRRCFNPLRIGSCPDGLGTDAARVWAFLVSIPSASGRARTAPRRGVARQATGLPFQSPPHRVVPGRDHPRANGRPARPPEVSIPSASGRARTVETALKML